MTKLRRGVLLLFEFLRTKTLGAVFTRQQILEATDWSEVTLKTYLSKNMLDQVLLELPGGDLRFLKEGSTITEADLADTSQRVEPKLKLTKGTILKGRRDHYRLHRKLGAGAVGHVWGAQPRSSNEAVALKIVNPRPDLLEPTKFANVKRRFGREVRNGMKLRNDAIVRYLDSGVYQEHEFLTMELASGSVFDILGARQKLPLADSAAIIGRCAEGLLYLHGEDCVHRDIKPQNILCLRGGYVLGDLGIVKWSDLNQAFVSAGTITIDSIQLGSWYYMAPEQVNAPHEAVFESDIYGLGVTWYHLLTGTTPAPQSFIAGDLGNPSPSGEVNELILRMVKYKPADRPSLPEILAVISNI